ncbi:MAG: cytochrome-c peroxidase [Steroidobacteraceae bacterium]
MQQKSRWPRGHLVGLVLGAMSLGTPIVGLSNPWAVPRDMPAPVENAPDARRVALGRLLFFDTRLSAKQNMSCASCHNPALGWSDGLERAIGFNMKQLARATPTIVNVGLNKVQMWDGRHATLEDQVLGPFLSPDEQNLPLEQLEERVRSIAGYRPLFEQAYPTEGIGAAVIAKAIASFERTLVSTDSPFDRWQQGAQNAVSESAKRGFALFTGKARCSLCHQPPNFTDNGFHNIGLKNYGEPEDVGRYAHLKIAILKGAFKTPTLRDIDLTAPYMHNGVYHTLEDVVEHYVRGGDDKNNLSPNIVPLDLNAAEKVELVAFMKTLTGMRAAVEVPQLPNRRSASGE